MSLFDSPFDEPKEKFPDKVLLEAIDNFSAATEGLAILDVKDISAQFIGVNSVMTTFKFSVTLRSEALPGYSFKVFDFGYDISIYPAQIAIEDGIGKELGVKKGIFGGYLLPCGSEADFLGGIAAIFKSKKFTETVGGLMKVARSRCV